MNSCASQASTAVCMSLDQPSSSSSSSNQFGGRTIDRHNPIIRDLRRTPKTLSLPPCTSQPPPINPQPYRLLQKTTKEQITQKISRKSNAKKDKKSSSNKRPTSEDGRKKKDSSTPAARDDVIVKKNWGKSVSDLITPPGSSRYLLSEKDLIEYDPVLALVAPPPPPPPQSAITHNLHSSSSSSSSTSNSSLRPSTQVVVLKVSLHCRGCEGKVRKHISRMEGVKSFNIDFAAKKVTIEGEVTPLGVLASVSKVKTAQFWTPPSLSTTK
ncbi:protein SODIUM POTASSIUM ROOT DEFECTIVE 2 [Euphorbia lathyris]|uniref:protein SODIUM POTASSIUM ROOT DEFECTIVE 2 n=1 Tax=Euphorbia lathyris TaxID=212925 RepID=UPI003313106D